MRDSLFEKSSDRTRLVTAAIGIPLVLLVVWLGSWPFGLVVGVLALIALRELEAACERAGTPLVAGIAYAVLILILLLAQFYVLAGLRTHWGAPLVFFLVWFVPVALLVAGVLAYDPPQRISLITIALTQLAVSYVGLFAFLILLRGFAGGGQHLFWIVLTGVWVGDSASYFFGRKFGKTPLTPLSPNKTLEGTVAGVVAALLVCVLVANSFGFGWGHALALGALISLAAPLGDLVESFWKRELQIKDLGTILPGHGGVLDRCDSLLFAAFAVYLYALWRI